MNGLSKLLKQKIMLYSQQMTIDQLFSDKIRGYGKELDNPPKTFFEYHLHKNKNNHLKRLGLFKRKGMFSDEYLGIEQVLDLETSSFDSLNNYHYYENTEVYRCQDFILVSWMQRRCRVENLECEPRRFYIDEEWVEDLISELKIQHISVFDYRTLLDKELSVNDYLKVYNYFNFD